MLGFTCETSVPPGDRDSVSSRRIVPSVLSERSRDTLATPYDSPIIPSGRLRRTRHILQQALGAELRTDDALRMYRLRKPQPARLSAWKICRITCLVQEKLAGPIRIADLAAEARLSPFHFCRAFRASLGNTPHQYVMRMRIERSLTLMRRTDFSLSQIAADCGFSDQSHLNKSFRKWMSISPGAWRRTWARAIPPAIHQSTNPLIDIGTNHEPQYPSVKFDTIARQRGAVADASRGRVRAV